MTPSQVDVMPAYKDQISDELFYLNLMIVADADDDDTGSSFSFQEADKVLVSQAATMQGNGPSPESRKGRIVLAESYVGNPGCTVRGYRQPRVSLPFWARYLLGVAGGVRRAGIQQAHSSQK